MVVVKNFEQSGRRREIWLSESAEKNCVSEVLLHKTNNIAWVNTNILVWCANEFFDRMYVNYPEWAALCGVNSKTDNSHGFSNPINYEMYRDFQENSINQDVIIIATSYFIFYLLHTSFSFFSLTLFSRVGLECGLWL